MKDLCRFTELKKGKYAYMLLSLILVVAGLIISLFPEMSAVIICRVVGCGLLLYGIIRFIGYFQNDLYGLAFQFDLALGIFSMLMGLILLIWPDAVSGFIAVVVGISVLIDSVFKLQTAVDAKRFGINRWVGILTLAVVSGILGLLLVINPYGGAATLMIMVGVTMILDGISNLFVAAYAIKLVKKNEEYNRED